MSRFFNSGPLQFNAQIYQDPHQLMMQVINKDNQMRAAYEDAAMKQEAELLGTQALAFDKDRLNRIVAGYGKDIDAITQDIYNDPNAGVSAGRKIRALQKKLMLDNMSGELGAIKNRYMGMMKFMEDNKKVEESDPDAYQLALAYEQNKLAQAVEKDPMAKFVGYSIIGKPDFGKDVRDTFDKLKASSIAQPNGGYIYDNKFVSEDRLRDLAVSMVLSNPKYGAYARQQTMYGQKGFFNDNGESISPFTFVSKDGKTATIDELMSMPIEQRNNYRKILNPEWRFANELNGLASGFAYNEQKISSDGTWVAKFREQNANMRHAQDMALKRERLEFDKMKDARDFNLRLEEHNAKMNGGYGGGSGSGSGRGGSGGLYGGVGTDGIINTQYNPQDFDYKSDIKEYRNSQAARARLEPIANEIRNSKNFRVYTAGGANVGDIAIRLMSSKGVNLTDGKAVAREMYKEAEVLIKRNGGSLTYKGKTYNMNNIQDLAGSMAYHVTSQVKPMLEKQYKRYSENVIPSQAIALNKPTANQVAEQLIHYGMNGKIELQELSPNNPRGRNVRYEDVAKSIDAAISQGKFGVRVEPGTNTTYGGSVLITVPSETGTKMYRVKGADFENSVMPMADAMLKSTYKPNDLKRYAADDFMKTFYSSRNAQMNYTGLTKSDINKIAKSFETNYANKIVGAKVMYDKGEIILTKNDGTKKTVPLIVTGDGNFVSQSVGVATQIASYLNSEENIDVPKKTGNNKKTKK